MKRKTYLGNVCNFCKHAHLQRLLWYTLLFNNGGTTARTTTTTMVMMMMSGDARVCVIRLIYGSYIVLPCWQRNGPAHNLKRATKWRGKRVPPVLLVE
jgi:hypothetical protein